MTETNKQDPRNPVPAEYEAELKAMHAHRVEIAAREARKALGLLTEEEVAAIFLLKSVGTLATWRSQKTGPAHIKLGKGVFYMVNQIGNWINEVAAKQQAPVLVSA